MMRKLIIASILLTLILVMFGANHGHHGGKPTPTPLPPPPQVTLAWDASVAATGYNLKLGLVSGAENQVTNVGNALTYTVQLTSGTTYYFVVTAYNSGGESLPSNEVSYTTP
jgi:Fibronectin type III domain